MRFGPKNLQISFTGTSLTHFGGVYLLHQFFKRLRLKSLLSQKTRFFQRNNHYSVAEILLSLIYPIILGLGRIETTHLLKYNGVFQYLTGLPAYPNPTTLRRFLLRMAPLALAKFKKFHENLFLEMMLKPQSPTRVVFDLDSTVLVLYGRQERAHIGYNPLKRGRPSYHPMLCFNGITKDFWYGELRPGDTHTASGIIEFLKICFAKLPPSMKTVIIRADKGFYDHKTIEFLESKRALFVIVAKLTKPLKGKLSTLSYRKYLSGLETAEFWYQPIGWEKEYRFISIRRPIPEDLTEQLTLFTMGKYSYQLIVTNMKLTPPNVWRFYNRRAAVELIIKELKGAYPLAKIPTKHFAANEAFFHILLFAYNLINWFKRLCLPKKFQNMTLSSLRYRLLLIPCEIVRPGNRPKIILPKNFLYKNAFEFAIKKIKKLKF